MKTLFENWSDEALVALLNGGYQGILLTLLVGWGVRSCPHFNAATRYVIWWICLGCVLALPIFHGLVALPSAKWELSARGGLVSSPVTDSLPSTWEDEISGFEESPLEVNQAKASMVLDVGLGTDGLDGVRNPVLVPSRSRQAGGEAVAKGRDLLKSLWPDWMGMGLVAGLIGWGLFRTLVLLRQFWLLEQSKRYTQPCGQALEDVFSRLKDELGVSPSVELRSGEEWSSPVVAGLWNPMVILPGELVRTMETSQWEAVLRHELAHLLRGDDWWNLIQRLVMAWCSFHPAVKMLSTWISLDREIACDDRVLEATEGPGSYALLLTDFAGRSIRGGNPVAPSAWNKKSQLKERINMLLNEERNRTVPLALGRMGMVGLGAMVVAGLGMGLAPRIALANPLEDEVAAKEAVTLQSAGSVDAKSAPKIKLKSKKEGEDKDEVNTITLFGEEPQASEDIAREGVESLEMRLARLEEAMKSLLNTQSTERVPKQLSKPQPGADLDLKSPDWDFKFNRKEEDWKPKADKQRESHTGSPSGFGEGMVRWMGDGEKNEMARLRRDLELQRKDLQKERQALALEHQKLALGQLAAVREKAREQQDELGKQIEATVKVDIDRHLKEIFEEQKALLEEHKQVAKRQAELAKQRANDAIGDLHSDHVVVPDVSLAVPIPPLSPVPLALPGIDVQIPHPGLAGPGMDDPFHVEKNPLEALRHQRERVRGDIKNLSQRLKGLEKELDRIEDQLEREQERREERAK